MKSLIVNSGEELIQALAARADEEGITDGAIVSLIGAVTSCALSNMSAVDAAIDVVTEHGQPYELSGTGEIVNGAVHLHVCLTGEGAVAIGGHLVWARSDRYPVRAYVVPFETPA